MQEIKTVPVAEQIAMATVCEVCYVSAEGDYLAIFHEDHAEKNIAFVLAKYLQCVNLEGIENPLICTTCWTTLESFHGLYNLVEDLHRPQSESSSNSDNDGEGPESETTITEVTEITYDEVDDASKDAQDAEPVDGDVESDGAATVEISEENYSTALDLIEEEDSCQEQLSDDEDTVVDYDDGDDDDGRQPQKYSKDSALITFYGALICQVCEPNRDARGSPSIGYDTFAELKRHMLEAHHIARTYLQCPLCSGRYFLRSKLWQHMYMHQNPDKFRCSTCGEVYQDLEAHVNNSHTKRQFECKHCQKRYPTANRLAIHAKVAHAPKDVVCNKCNKAFSKFFIKTHMRSIHGDPVYVCEWCGKAYRTLGMLNKHKMQHQSVATVACPVCKQRVRANYLDGHMKLMHTESTPVECAACEKSFLNKRTLLAHLKRSCAANANRCETCSKRFKTAAKMTEHQRTHGESACIYYMCPVCMERFESKSLLYVHQQEMHKNMK